MREQSEKGAQWIPACLLQILPHQVIRSTLPTSHVPGMMAKALRLPAHNAAMIVKEGFKILGATEEPLVSGTPPQR